MNLEVCMVVCGYGSCFVLCVGDVFRLEDMKN